MSVRKATESALRRLSAPLLGRMDVLKWPRIAARVHDLSLPSAVIPNPEPAPYGAANINIILDLLDEVAAIPGSVAECGVYRGNTLIPLSIHLRSVASLARCADEVFSFVHLDCDLYGSYRDCLEFFYPRLSDGGIVLLDEYDDPPWPGCNKAVDEFLAGKPERLQRIERQNYQKYFFRKRERPAAGDSRQGAL
jgi:hypothetical protein